MFNPDIPVIDWSGGPCPLDLDALVKFKARNGIYGKVFMARHLDWAHYGRPLDIVAYQIIEQETEDSSDDTDEILESFPDDKVILTRFNNEPVVNSGKVEMAPLPNADDTEKVCEQLTALEIWSQMCELYPTNAYWISRSIVTPVCVRKYLGDKCEWSGEGMPPIGVEVEYLTYESWFKCVVIAITDTNVFYRQLSNDMELIHRTDCIKFRQKRDPSTLLFDEHVNSIKDIDAASDILKFIESGGVPGYGKVE